MEDPNNIFDTDRNDIREFVINSSPKRDDSEESFLRGLPSSPGTGIGNAAVIKPEQIFIPSNKLPPEKIPEEIERLNYSLRELADELTIVLEKVKNEPGNVSAILESNLMMLSDSFFVDSIKSKIEKGYSTESSIVREIDERKYFFTSSRDRILRERAVDLDHIKERLLAILRNKCVFYAVGDDAIVVAQSLTPPDIVNFKESGVLGIITEVGGITSHTSILARSFEIPMVIGVKNATDRITDKSNIIIDGYSGHVIRNPSKDNISKYIEKKTAEEEHHKKLGALVKLPARTTDGKHIKLLANVDFIEDVESSILVGAEGIGLVRTEHLIFPVRTIPDENEQYNWYKALADRSYPNPVTIRVFDVGSDKYAEGIPKHEDNPALGFRGIRFLLSRRDLFEAQVKAILRASANRNVRLLLPMVTRIREVLDSVELIEKCKFDLMNRNIEFDENIPIGVMMETPSAALITREISREADFISIGTNDLTQYTLAADRTNELVSDYFDPFHPAVIRLIKHIVDTAHKNDTKVGLCGEFAGHALSTPLLIGLDLDELSVAPSVLLELKSRIRNSNYEHSSKLTKDLLRLSCQKEIRDMLDLAQSM